METSMLNLLQSLVREAGYNYEIARSKGDRGEEQSRAFVVLDLAKRALRLHSPDTEEQVFYCSSPLDIAKLQAQLDEAGIQGRIVVGKPPGWS